MSNKEELKIAYIEAIKANGLNISTLRLLHTKSKNVIEKWLYVKDRYPDFQACYELYLFLNGSRKTVPIALNKIIEKPKSHVSQIIRDMGLHLQKQNALTKRYTFKSRLMSISDIAIEIGSTYQGVYNRILRRKFLPGDDVSSIVVHGLRGRKKETI